MPGPRYEHLVWNRTDLTVSKGNLQVAYQNAVPPLVHDSFPPDNYQGETIPPYAVMRVISNPVLYKERVCWLVGRPDDASMSEQAAGVHFFNGPCPIPVKGFGEGTNELPAPVLIDLTVDSATTPYGNLNGPISSSASADDTGWLMGYASGSWALHPGTDIVNFGSGLFKISTQLVGSGSVTLSAVTMPYVILGRHPVQSSGKTAGLTDSPEIEFLYSNQIFWVGSGALGFGAESTSGG